MKKYLVIENSGEVDIRNFTLLGISTARDNEGTIGQFGSGAKHGILIALRTEREIAITTGNTTVTPYTKDEFINNLLVQQVAFRIDKDNEDVKHIDSSMTLGFGELDWKTEAHMMLREFVSNALDAVNQDWDEINVYITTEIRTEPRKTRVYIELDNEIRKCYADITSYFLHATKQHEEKVIPIPRTEIRLPRIYRKGVLVTEVQPEEDGPKYAIFDYNDADKQISVDESRNMTAYDMKNIACCIFFSPQKRETLHANIETVLRTCVIDKKNIFESTLSYGRMQDAAVATVVKKIWGDDIIITSNKMLANEARKYGKVVLFPPHMRDWFSAAKFGGVTTAEDVVDTVLTRVQGLTDIEDTATIIKVIDILAEYGYIDKQKKRLPRMQQYTGMLEGDSLMKGYATKDGVYLSHCSVNDVPTIVEEVLHYYTGMRDCTRDFQDLLVNITGRLIGEKLC